MISLLSSSDNRDEQTHQRCLAAQPLESYESTYVTVQDDAAGYSTPLEVAAASHCRLIVHEDHDGRAIHSVPRMSSSSCSHERLKVMHHISAYLLFSVPA